MKVVVGVNETPEASAAVTLGHRTRRCHLLDHHHR